MKRFCWCFAVGVFLVIASSVAEHFIKQGNDVGWCVWLACFATYLVSDLTYMPREGN